MQILHINESSSIKVVDWNQIVHASVHGMY